MHTDAVGVVGPNAIIQTAGALHDIAGSVVQRDVFARAGLLGYLERPPEAMVPQSEVAVLFAALRSGCVGDEVDAILAESGRRTGQYILAHRIPPAAAYVISRLPAVIGSRVLLTAIARHAWTFAGSGRVTITRARRLSLAITANPLATPGCPWHVATLAELFGALVTRAVRIRHPDCCAKGSSVCRFELAW